MLMSIATFKDPENFDDDGIYPESFESLQTDALHDQIQRKLMLANKALRRIHGYDNLLSWTNNLRETDKSIRRGIAELSKKIIRRPVRIYVNFKGVEPYYAYIEFFEQCVEEHGILIWQHKRVVLFIKSHEHLMEVIHSNQYT